MRVVIALLASTAIAHAEPPGLTPVAEPAPPASPDLTTESYRGQVLAADGAALGLGLLALVNGQASGRATNTTSLLELGAATFLIGAPLVHLLHDRSTHALGSLGLRLALPVLAGFIGSQVHDSCNYPYDGYCDSNGGLHAAIGAAAGIIAASVIDAVFLAGGDERPTTTRMIATPLAGGGATVGLAGRF